MRLQKLFILIVAIVPIFSFAAWPALQSQSGLASSASKSMARFAFGGNAAEIPAEFVEGLVFLPVRIFGSQPSLFEVASAEDGSSIDRKRSDELGLKVVATPQNPSSSEVFEIPNAVITVPGVDIPLPSLPLRENQRFAAAIGRLYQGSLGGDFLSRVVVEVDYGRRTVRIYDPNGFAYSGKGSSIPLSFSGTTPVIHAKFNLTGGKKGEGEFVIDTGLNQPIVFSEPYARSRRLFSAHLRTIPDLYPAPDGTENLILGRIKSFEVGKYPSEEVIAAFSQPEASKPVNSKIAGVVGGKFLSRFVVTFDFPHHQLFLEPSSRFNDFVEADMSGLSIIARGPNLKIFEVNRVEPHTPGSDAGLKKGDIIAGIDEEPAADLTLAEIRGLFRQIGHEYKLLIDRNGQDQTITIKMRRLI